MDSPEETINPITTSLTRYTVGDLIHSSDGKTMGLIREIKKDGFINEYKIDFYPVQYGLAVPHAWKTEWWKETSIQARLISHKWSMQKCGTNKI